MLEFLEGLVRYYLNATAPLNVAGCVNACVYELNESTSNVVNCTVAEGSAQDSFMWCVCPVHVHVLTFGEFIHAPGTTTSTFRSRRPECSHVRWPPS